MCNLLLEPYWMFSAHAPRTAQPTVTDAHVPVIFMGSGSRPEGSTRPFAVNDIAPTLATLLGVETPSGSVGRVLREIFDH